MSVKEFPAFDPDGDSTQDAASEGAAPVPRDAATLVIYRLDDIMPRILLGRRAGGHDFMPDKYVFPGGRVDDEDELAPSLSELEEAHERALRHEANRAPRAFPLTAIREVYEETGLIVGRPAEAPRIVPQGWSEYYAHCVQPCLKGFSFIGRAITPPMRRKRFDARFFMVDAADCLIDDRAPVDGRELADLRWFTLNEAALLDLPSVTRFVISDIEARLKGEQTLRPFFLRWSAQGHVNDRI